MPNYSLVKLNNNFYFEKDLMFSVKQYTVEVEPQLHWHEFYEIEYVVSGTATHIINDKTYRIGPGDMQLITPVDFHTYKYEEGDECLNVINVKFHDMFLPSTLRNDICNQTSPMQVHNMPGNVLELLKSMLEEYSRERYGRDVYIEAAISQLIVHIIRHMPHPIKDAEAPSSYSSIQEAILYIRAHFRSPITAEAVAKTVHLSPNYFSEYFQKQTGEKFSLFVLRLRIDFAANLLKTSDMSIKEIAFESGFNSAAYFSNTFKDYFGVSPDRYRKEHSKGKSNN